MRIQRARDDDIRELVDLVASSWSGPSPAAGQSRWAARAAARHSVSRVAWSTAAYASFTALAFGVSMAAASQSPAGAAGGVVHLVSHVLPGATTMPSATAGAASPPGSTSAPAPSPHPTSPIAARPAPSPVRWTGSGVRSPEPDPSESPRAPASALPSPSPSPPPDR